VKGIKMQIIELMVESPGDRSVGILETSNRITIILHDADIDGSEFEDMKSFFAEFFDGKCTTFEQAMKAYIIQSLEEEKMYQEMKDAEDETRL
jgi:hypothetical protein